jgi:hypothetical protein
MTTKLNDLQLILLSHAAKTDGGSALPLPDSVTDQPRAEKELKALLRRSLLAETETSLPAASWREDGNIHFGLIITKQGTDAIGLGDAEDGGHGETGNDGSDAETPAPAREARSDSKIARVLALLRRTEGATLAELVEATGWLPHTTRAALTGLKKKGHVITKSKRDDTTCYHIAGEA